MRAWRDEIGSQSRMMLWALVGAALCVLLIACTNLANLLMSRALARRGEFAVRAAVGASLDRLVRQMITDSLLLAAAGGALGVALAVVAAPLVVRLVPFGLPISEVPPLDARMLAGAGILTLVTGLAFGVLPALRISRTADATALKEGARGGTSRGTERMRSALVVAEIVASVVLLVSAGLLIEALWKVQASRSRIPQRERAHAEDHAAASEVRAGGKPAAVLSAGHRRNARAARRRARRLRQLYAVHDARRHVGSADDQARSDQPRRV